MEDTPAPAPIAAPAEKVADEVAAIAERMEREIRQAAMPGPGHARPVAQLHDRRIAELNHERVKLRCESILLMAFQVWLQEVRGSSPFVGPADIWKLNEMKRQLFSIGEKTQDF